MNLLVILLLIVSVIASGLFVAYVNISSRTLKLILSFSGAYLFAICVLHLVPEVYSGGNKWVGIYILIGFLLQILLEFFSEGIEHGHIHVHEKHQHRFPLVMMLGLCIHSFLEAMPLVENGIHPNLDRNLLFGIVLHNLPIAMALMTTLLQTGYSKRVSITNLSVFALMAPLGILTSSYLGNFFSENLESLYSAMMGIVIGIFLHISTTILFESTENHRFNLLKFIIILLGSATALISILLVP